MTETGLVKRDTDAILMEKAVIEGDLGSLTARERVAYYTKVCDSLGLNPFTKPFSYIKLNNKLVLYANKDCTEQLRRRDGISLTISAREVLGDIYVVTAKALTSNGRADESTGAVPIKGVVGEFLANAYMKAESKAKRRVTLSICGLGWLDETETESVPDAKIVQVDALTGEIEDKSKNAPPRPEPPVSSPETMTMPVITQWGELFTWATKVPAQGGLGYANRDAVANALNFKTADALFKSQKTLADCVAELLKLAKGE